MKLMKERQPFILTGSCRIASLLDPGNSRLYAQHVVPLLNPDFPVEILEGGDG